MHGEPEVVVGIGVPDDRCVRKGVGGVYPELRDGWDGRGRLNV